MYREGNTKKIILISILVISLLALMRYTEFGRVSISPVESSLRDILAPVQGLAMNLGHRLRGLVSFPFAVMEMVNENQSMKEKVAELEGRLRQSEEFGYENDRLKRLLDYKSAVTPLMGFEVTGAAVIGRNPGNWFGTITINKGSDDGMKQNMTVITEQGLVGRITSVSINTSEVLLITDPRSGVSALIQESRAPGMVEGIASSPGRVIMVHIPIEIDISADQVVVTSGFGSIYPKGIPVGRILETGKEPSGLFNNAVIAPFVDINRLEEVMVITTVRSSNNITRFSGLPSPWGEGGFDQGGLNPEGIGGTPVGVNP